MAFRPTANQSRPADGRKPSVEPGPIVGFFVGEYNYFCILNNADKIWALMLYLVTAGFLSTIFVLLPFLYLTTPQHDGGYSHSAPSDNPKVSQQEYDYVYRRFRIEGLSPSDATTAANAVKASVESKRK